MIGTLTAAIAAAARAAGRIIQVQDLQSSLEQRKVAIDGAATLAAEAILSQGNFRLTVSAGEGARDHSPGAKSGQVMGVQNSSAPSVNGIFDYVDGTTLAANAEPGALALGAIGRGVREVPDLETFAIIGPRDGIVDLDLTAPFEESASQGVTSLAKFLGKPASNLAILTHSLGSNRTHQTLIEHLRGLVGDVIVPPGVSVEPPYLLSLIGLSNPRIDALVGGIGLSELCYAAALLDLIAPHFGIRFRLASVEGPRTSADSTMLDPLLDFTPEELLAIENYSLSPHMTYSGDDLLTRGRAIVAAMFAVTPNPILGWPGASETGGQAVTGLVALPNKEVIRLQIKYH